MNSSIPTIKIVLYKQKVYANGEHPIMIQSIQNRKTKSITLGLTCSAELWDFKKNEPKKKHPQSALIQKILSLKMDEYRAKILETIQEGKDIDPTTLLLEERKTIKLTVFEYFDDVIEALKTSNKIGNSQVYKETYNSFKKFRKNKDLHFSDLTVSMLTDYETYLRSFNLKDTTLSVRFRTLRALFKRAILNGKTLAKYYPFDNFKISGKKFNLETKRTALSKEDFEKIRDLETGSNEKLTFAKHFFLFSYYGAGINFIDFCKLKPENIVNGRVFYKRSKTRSEVQFILLEPAKEIIEYYKENRFEYEYLFPVLNSSKHITDIQKDNRINKVNGQVNKALKEIAKLCNIQTNLTSGVARHTFATALKRGGANTAVIQELMKHKTQAITQTYLASFGDEVKDEAMLKLL
jgi:integrase